MSPPDEASARSDGPDSGLPATGGPTSPPRPRPGTERARRSLASRLAPIAVMLLGVFFVAAAAARLDGIYEGDPGVLRSRQLAPHSLAVAYAALPAVGDLRELVTQSGFATGPCKWQLLAGLCRIDPPMVPVGAERMAALEGSARDFVAGAGGINGSTDVTLVHWRSGRDRIVVVAVARFSVAESAAQALVRSTSGRNDPLAGHPVARTAWPAGKHVLVGVLASAADQAAADDQLAKSSRQTATYVGTARVIWFEALALLPLLVLFTMWVSVRWISVLVLAVVVAAVGIVVLVPLLIVLLVILLVVGRKVLARRRSADAGDAGAGTSTAVAPPAEGPPVQYRHVDVPWGVWLGVDESEREAFLVVTVFIGFGIAALTTSLFPGSLAWGSLVLAAVLPAWTRGMRHLPKVRKAFRWLLGGAIASILFGFAPYALLGDGRLQLLLIAVGLGVLVGQWRDLTAGAELTYANKWYEDVDARSTLFLVGAAVLMISAGSLFLASNGNTDVGAHVGEKVLATAGLLVAVTASSNVRASRDAARRNRARELGTPPVLYLRSFGDDELTAVSPRMQRVGLERLSWRRRELFEDVIAASLSRIGPVVAIAKPGTGQRDLGPARDSIVTDDWLGAVRSYMGEAALVAVVIGSSQGLVRELETLGELGLLDRLCLFVPPVSDDEVARRLAVLGRQPGYSNTWGVLRQDKKHQIVALTSIDGASCVVTASRRTAYAYRKCAVDIPAAHPATTYAGES